MAEWRENQLATPNRATRALGDVLQRLAQARRHGCRGTPDFSNGRTTQVRLANLLEGLKQQSRVQSSATWPPPRSISEHQATTSLRRLRSGHQPSQQVLGLQQGEHGRLLPRSPQAREKNLRSRVPSRRLRQQRCSRRPVEAWFYSRSSTSGCLHPRASRAIHPGASAHDH
jgi:hypothetical protein